MSLGRAGFVALVSIAMTMAAVAACTGTPSGSSTGPPSSATTTSAPAKLPPEIGSGGYTVDIRSVDFPTSTKIDNPYFPLSPGARRGYEVTGAEGSRSIASEVTAQTKTILGVQNVVVHDVVTADGAVVEDTFDWYAQDKDGNVWYFGEVTRKADPSGQLTDTEGSWEAGVAGAQPGLVMKVDRSSATATICSSAKGLSRIRPT
jgi:hypothetical protein